AKQTSAQNTFKPEKREPATPARSRKDIPAIAKAAKGAVVSVIMSDKDGQPVTQGTGFLIGKDGRIVTNYHVIEEGTSAVVKLPDGDVFPVEGVLASDKSRDVAIIKVHGNDFRPLTLGDSDLLQVGEEVVAIGSPLSLESTVSNGIVSSIRTIDEEGGKYLQVTAPISPGSSGGPLFNMAGEVVGITTMYLKGGENLNFAIPINDAKPLLFANASKLQNFPDESPNTESASTEQASTAHEGPVVQVASPQFKYYNELLEGKDAALLKGTYACFDDDPKKESFALISAHVDEDRQNMFVALVSYKNGVQDPHPGAYLGKLDWNSSDGTIAATLPSVLEHLDPVDKAIHQTDHLQWSPYQIVIETAFGGPSDPMAIDRGYYAIKFVMQRSSLRYITTYSPRGSVDDGRLNKRTIFSGDAAPKTGQCVRIPGAQTPEQQYRSLR